MKNSLLRTGALALLLLGLLTLTLSGCATPQSPAARTTESPETEPISREFVITADTVIVRADENEDALDAVRALQAAIEQIYGFKPAIRTDFLMGDEKPFPSEILVGVTNREIAAGLYQDLTYRDYRYQVLSSSTVAIVGGSPAASVEAVNAFLSEQFGYTGEGSGAPCVLPCGPVHNVEYTYPVTKLTLGGKALSDFTVSYDTGTKFRTAALALADAIESLTGTPVPVAKNASAVKTAYSIHLGKDEKASEFSYLFSSDKGSLRIGATADTIEGAVAHFIATYFPATLKGTVDVPAPETAVEGYAFNSVETYNLVYQKTTDQVKVCAGVKRYTRHYVDRNGNPTKVYVIECAPGSVTPRLGTKNAGYSVASTQQILDQIKAEEDTFGVDICAAVNGCLYRWNNDKIEPFGVCIKNGKVVTSLQRDGYAVFGVKKNGDYFFGYPNQDGFRESDMEMCVSGAYLLMKNNKLTDMGLWFPDLSFAHTRHPRTAIGVKPDGPLFLAVVAGRQKGFSLGVTLPDLALIFKEMGCSDAVNIDGGGSSISYTMDYKTGKYKMWNKPSDGSPRAVICCVLLARNEEYEGE